MTANTIVLGGNGLVLGCVISLSASAAEPVEGCVRSAAGKNVVQSAAGGCVRTGQKYTYEYLEECG